MLQKSRWAALCFLQSTFLFATTFNVVNTNSSGTGSLPDAVGSITLSNDIVMLNIPGSGTQTITLQTVGRVIFSRGGTLSRTGSTNVLINTNGFFTINNIQVSFKNTSTLATLGYILQGDINVGSSGGLSIDTDNVAFQGGTINFTGPNSTFVLRGNPNYSNHPFTSNVVFLDSTNVLNSRVDASIPSDNTVFMQVIDTQIQVPSSTTFTWAGPIQDDGVTPAGFILTGGGTFVILEAATYTGTTVVQDGTLMVQDNGDISSSSAVVVNGILDFTASNLNPITINDLSGTTAGAFVNSDTQQININLNTPQSYAGNITGSGQLNFVPNGGSLTLSSEVDYGGLIYIQDGATVYLAGNGDISTTDHVTVDGLLDVTQITGASTSLSNLGGSTTGVVSLGTKSLFIFCDDSAVYQGDITGSTGTISLAGAGTIEFTNLLSQTGPLFDFTNTTVIFSGDGDISSDSIKVDGILDLSQSTKDPFILREFFGADNSAILSLGTINVQINNTLAQFYIGDITGSQGTITLSGGGPLEFQVAIDYAGQLNIADGNTLNMTQDATISSLTATIVDGTLDISGAAADPFIINNLSGASTGTLSIGNLDLEFHLSTSNTYNGDISGSAGSVVLIGSGSLALTQAALSENSFTLNATFDLSQNGNSPYSFNQFSGTDDNAALVLGPLDIEITNPAINLYKGNISGNGSISIFGGGGLELTHQIDHTGTFHLIDGSLFLTGNGSIAQMTQVEVSDITCVLDISGSTQGTVSVQNIFGDGNIVLGNNTLQNYMNTSGDLAGDISGTGSVILTGTGRLGFNVPTSYTGTTTINSAATLALTDADLIPHSSSVICNGTIDINYGGTLATTINNLSGTNTAAVVTTANSLILKNTATSIYSGSFVLPAQTPTLSITKTGSGKLSINNSSPAAHGALLVTQGELNVNGSFVNMDVTVSSGGLLSGNGAYKNGVINGIMSPGNSIGTQTFVNYSVGSTGTLIIEVSPDGTSDHVIASGTAVISPGATLMINPFSGAYANQTFTFLEATGGVTGTFSNLIMDPQFDFTVLYNSNNIQLISKRDANVNPVDTSLLTGYARTMAEALFCTNLIPTGDIAAIQAVLVRLSPEEYVDALTHLVPGQISGLPIVELENTNRMIGLMQSRVSRFNQSSCNTSSTSSKISYWASPTTFWLRQSSNDGTFAFKSNTAGFGLGVENKFYENLLIGLGIGYTYSGVSWNQNVGKAYMNDVYVAPYIAAKVMNFNLSGAILGSYDSTQLNRHLQFGVLDRTAESCVRQWNVAALMDAQGMYNLGTHFYMTPEVALTFAELFRQSATETGAASLDVHYPSGFNTTMRSFFNWGLGVRGCPSQNLSLDGKIQLGYLNTQMYTSNLVKAQILDTTQVCDPYISVVGNLPSINQGVIGFALMAQSGDSAKIGLKSNYTFGGHSSVAELDFNVEVNF